MELKLSSGGLYPFFRVLLIVPYGIETAYRIKAKNGDFDLLIVPYGIETNIHKQKSLPACAF